jgi:hypothetical protein
MRPAHDPAIREMRTVVNGIKLNGNLRAAAQAKGERPVSAAFLLALGLRRGLAAIQDLSAYVFPKQTEQPTACFCALALTRSTALQRMASAEKGQQ